MTYEEIVDYVLERGEEGAVLFSEPSYETAFVGVSEDGRAVYEWQKMVEYLVKEYDMSFEEAADFIDVNALKSLPYKGPLAPIVFTQIEEYHG